MDSPPFALCPQCGKSGGAWRRGHEFRCPDCGFRFFHNVAAAAGVLLQRDDRWLFLERGRDPARGKLGLPGGFVDPGESLEVALHREVAEEIGGAVTEVRYLTSFPNVYRFGGIAYHTCDVYFRARLMTPEAELKVEPTEVSALRWLRADEVRDEDLAFDSLRRLWSFLRTEALLG